MTLNKTFDTLSGVALHCFDPLPVMSTSSEGEFIVLMSLIVYSELRGGTVRAKLALPPTRFGTPENRHRSPRVDEDVGTSWYMPLGILTFDVTTGDDVDARTGSVAV